MSRPWDRHTQACLDGEGRLPLVREAAPETAMRHPLEAGLARLLAVLLRHGEYEQPRGVPSAHLPHPLTPAGAAQARRAGEELLAWLAGGWELADPIDSSRLLRAWQTAHVVAEVIGKRLDTVCHVAEHDALAERSLGAAANLTAGAIETIVARDPRYGALPRGWKQGPSIRLPFLGAESLRDAGVRVAAHIESACAACEPGRGAASGADAVKLFVGHGGAFRFAAVRLGVLAEAEAVGLSMHHCSPLYLERLRDGAWVHRAGSWKRRTSAPDADCTHGATGEAG
jgi:2,3-bisphosphoglycerate-dependent phosphoglycerate mutase